MTDLVRINSTILSGTSCSWKFAGVPFVGIQALDYDEKRPRKLVYGSHKAGLPLGWTSGKYEPPVITVSMLRDSADKLTTLLTPLGLGSYGDAEFPFIAQYSEPAQIPITCVFTPCVIVGVKEGMNDEELTTDLSIATLSLTKNGKRLWSLIRSLSL